MARQVTVQAVVPPIAARPHEHIHRVYPLLLEVAAVALHGNGEWRHHPRLGKVVGVILAERDAAPSRLPPFLQVGLAVIAVIVITHRISATPVCPHYALF